MNETQIKNMPAGREMDVLVAKALDLDPQKDSLGVWRIEEGALEWRQLPFYSTRMEAAWEIVNSTKDVYMWQLSVTNNCQAAFIPRTLDTSSYSAASEFMPVAICRALLQARGLTMRAADAESTRR